MINVSTIKNGQISLCCHFNKIVKGLELVPVSSIEPKTCPPPHLF